jgi:hypothetical protein
MTEPAEPAVAEPVQQYATPEVSEAWRRGFGGAAPVWYTLVSELNQTKPEFAKYVADDAERAVQRGFAQAEARAQEQAPIAAAELAGHREATALIDPHREAVTLMIEAPAATESTLTIEAVPGEPDTFA